MFLQHDGQEDGDPITHEGEEVLENVEQMVPARDAADELDDDDEDDPEPAGDGLGETAQDLQVDGRGVGAGDVVLDGGEGEDDGAEGAEAAEAGAVGGEEEGARGGRVGGRPGRGGGDTRGDADADEVDEDEGAGQAEPGHEEGERFARSGRVVDVEVGPRGAPADRDGVLQGEVGKAVRGDFAKGAGDGCGGGEGGVEVWGRRAEEDEEGDTLRDEGPSMGGSNRVSWVFGFGGNWANHVGVFCRNRTFRIREERPCRRLLQCQ